MTREEAKELLLHILMTYEPKDQYGDYDDPEPYEQALTMAIEALQAEYEDYEHATLVDIKEPLKVSVVRCKDCRYYWGNLGEDDTDEMYGECRWDSDEMPNADDFCSYGERAEQTDIPIFKESAEAYKKMTGEDMWTPCNKWIGE